MTHNGSAYRSSAYALSCRRLDLRHLPTRPYRPRTNGKAERSLRTLLREWAYVRLYRDSPERLEALPRYYNCSRPHGSLGRPSPGARLAELNNVARNYT
jgi:transposase InsO family protein